MKKTHYLIALLLILSNCLTAQDVTVEGYAFEENNRGYLAEVNVKITDADGAGTFCEVFTNEEGFFSCTLPADREFVVLATKDVFKDLTQSFSTKGKRADETVYVKLRMERAPGYLLDVTLSEKFDEEKGEVDAIQGALIEIYNNTTRKEEMVLKNHPSPVFQYTLKKGNHYTLMIRKEGFFTKRIEAYVDVDGCILCLDGVSEMSPGVSDNLTEGNEMGTLLANIELERAELNKSIEVKNIYYDYNSARIKTAAKAELDKLVFLLKNNPSMLVELGSHTDARGKADYNQKLSQQRAESAVEYITTVGEISPDRITAKGYGETRLVNKCADGTECTEDQHQENRRTELTITGFNAAAADDRSLAQIMEEENFEEMLQEVLSQEVVEVPAGEEMPDDLARALEEQEKAAETKPTPTAADTAPAEPATGGELVTIDEKEEDPFAPQETEPTTTETTAANTTAGDDPFAPRPGESAVVGETKINTGSANQAAPVPVNYTGFKIEIWKSTEQPLTKNHRIFNQHGNIMLDVVKNEKFSYMIGNFANYEAADDYMRESLLVMYPAAKVIQYKAGERLDY